MIPSIDYLNFSNSFILTLKTISSDLFENFEWKFEEETHSLFLRYQGQSQNRSLWKNYESSLIEILKDFLDLEVSVSLSIEGVLDPLDCEILEKLIIPIESKITQFSFLLKEYNDEQIDAIIALIMRMDKLTDLRIIGDDELPLEEASLDKIFKVCRDLQSFSVDNFPSINSNSIIKVIEESRKLRHLRLNPCNTYDHAILETLEKKCLNLRELYLQLGSSELDVKKEALFDLFKACKSLTTLRFYNSALAPPCNGDCYNLGVLNDLQSAFPERQIRIDYDFEMRK